MICPFHARTNAFTKLLDAKAREGAFLCFKIRWLWNNGEPPILRLLVRYVSGLATGKGRLEMCGG